MSEQSHLPQNHRRYEGPARLLNDNLDEFSLRERRYQPRSYEDNLTYWYGPENTGWAFDTEDPRHEQTNAEEELSHGPEFAIATEAMRNWLYKGRYETDDGQDMTGKVQRYTRAPKMGNVVVYPDGDVFRSEHRPSA